MHFFAPIETMHKQTSVVTGVPSGRMNKEVVYELSTFIGDNNDDTSNSSTLSSGSNDDAVDEEFVDLFTLSYFGKDLMVLVGDQFPEEYGTEKKSLDLKCKLFVQEQWNSSAWTEIPSA